jgi:hypothetical protein
MRYTLKSRFRGTLAGALLALNLARTNIPEYTTQAYHQVAVSCKSLIKHGKFSVDTIDMPDQVESIAAITQQALLNTVFSTLPVALFFHENIVKLRQSLLEVARTYSHDLIIRDSALALGYVIAQSLNEKLHPASLLNEVTNFIGETPTNLPKQLQTVNDLLYSKLSLEQAYSELYKVNTLANIIATAFYTFLKSIEEFRLSVSLHLSNSASEFRDHNDFISSAITGAISGAYNSASGIPISWQIDYLRSFSAKTPENDFLQMLRLTDELLAVWSGVYDLNQQADELSFMKDLCTGLPLLEDNPHLCVYAAPRIIRLR